MDPLLGMLTLGAASWLIGLLSVAFLFCSVLLILTVLIQRPQGGGLSGAFGAGAGSGETAFGARTGDALTIATISFFVIWLLVAVGLVVVMQPQTGPTETRAVSTEPPAVPESTGGAPTGTEQPAEGAQPGETGAPPTDQPSDQPAEQPVNEPPGGGAADQGGGDPSDPADDQTGGGDSGEGGDGGAGGGR